MKYRITPRARDDLENNARYTQNNWGRVQRNNYMKNFETRFEWLAENPGLGKHRIDIAEEYYSFPEGQHVVFYLLNQQWIEIIGILHKNMDVISYFQPQE